MKFIVHTDGGSRGNPGPAGIGVVIEKIVDDGSLIVDQHTKGELVHEFGKVIGETTNNVAEYTAVVEALQTLIHDSRFMIQEGNLAIHFFLDSELVVKQLNGLYKVKDQNLRGFLLKIRALEGEVGGTISYTHVRREQNTRADFLVNQALDRS